MKTLESLFRRFGSPAEEMNERINIYGMRALKRFEALRKEYPNTEAIKKIDKYQWER